ncbi:hypothetical protein JCM3775_001598 [Rhodotorula graminis]
MTDLVRVPSTSSSASSPRRSPVSLVVHQPGWRLQPHLDNSTDAPPPPRLSLSTACTCPAPVAARPPRPRHRAHDLPPPRARTDAAPRQPDILLDQVVRDKPLRVTSAAPSRSSTSRSQSKDGSRQPGAHDRGGPVPLDRSSSVAG